MNEPKALLCINVPCSLSFSAIPLSLFKGYEQNSTVLNQNKLKKKIRIGRFCFASLTLTNEQFWFCSFNKTFSIKNLKFE
jgi:hypothetical protein